MKKAATRDEAIEYMKTQVWPSRVGKSGDLSMCKPPHGWTWFEADANSPFILTRQPVRDIKIKHITGK